MPFDIARARYQRGTLLGGTAGAALIASARDVGRKLASGGGGA